MSRKYEAETILRNLRNSLTRYIHDGVELTGDDVFSFCSLLEQAGDEVKAMSVELSRQRSNDFGEEDGLANEVFEQVKAGTVAQLPVFARPIPVGSLQNKPKSTQLENRN